MSVADARARASSSRSSSTGSALELVDVELSRRASCGSPSTADGGVDLDASPSVTRARLAGARRADPIARPLHARGVEPRARAAAAHARALRAGPSGEAVSGQDPAAGRRAATAGSTGVARSPPTTTAIVVRDRRRRRRRRRRAAPAPTTTIERARTVFEWGPARQAGGEGAADDRADEDRRAASVMSDSST